MKPAFDKIAAGLNDARAFARGDKSRATLRQLYNSTLTERIPDDIRDLIERLR